MKKFILPLLLISVVLTGCTQTNTAVVVDNQQAISPVSYTIAKVDDLSIRGQYLGDVNAPITKRMSYRIVVSQNIKSIEIKPTIERIISDITAKNSDIDEINLFVYSDTGLVNGSYDIAMAERAPNGKRGSTSSEVAQSNNRNSYKITIQIKDNLEK